VGCITVEKGGEEKKKMEDSLGQKWKQREFTLASVSDLSVAPPSALPGTARFDSDGLQIHQQSHQIPLSIDPRTVQVRFHLLLLRLAIARVKQNSFSRNIMLCILSYSAAGLILFICLFLSFSCFLLWILMLCFSSFVHWLSE